MTNVAAFGAFVDIGVHQDGLVHVSAMAERFVADPHDVVRSGQVVRVKVIDVDVERRRVGLSLRLNDDPQRRPVSRLERRNSAHGKNFGHQSANSPAGSMARALRDAGFGR